MPERLNRLLCALGVHRACLHVTDAHRGDGRIEQIEREARELEARMAALMVNEGIARNTLDRERREREPMGRQEQRRGT